MVFVHTRPTRQGAGGRPYIGPKAQTTVDEKLWDRIEDEAKGLNCAMSDVWREVIYAGLVATNRATPAEIRAAAGVR